MAVESTGIVIARIENSTGVLRGVVAGGVMSIPLNPAQKAAVEHMSGPALVLAGAGSGKTRVITQRIARLIDLGTPAGAITAVTFTHKAAEEMRERLVGLCGAGAGDVWISTFHALGGEIVKREMPRGETFVVYDAADQAGVVKEILRDQRGDLDKRFDVGAVIARISHAKNAMTTPEALPELGAYDEIARWVFPRYEAALKRLHAMDFDDLILWPLKKLTDDAGVRENWQRRIRFLLVDEFQDTNRAQLLMVKALAGERGNILCVGDDDQSIYGWRGADIANVTDFATHFPGAKVYTLEQNYRSRRPILEIANAVMEGVPRPYPKKLHTERTGGDRVRLVVCDSSEGETKYVCDTLQKLISDGHKKREIGVLYRSNQLSKAMEDSLRLANVPYRLIGGSSVYERREVKDLLAYLRLAVHPADEIAFRRVINYPTRGVGDVTLARIERFALSKDITLLAALAHVDTLKEIPQTTREALRSFASLVTATREKLERGEPLADVARAIAGSVRLKEDIAAAGPTALVVGKRWGNVEALFRTLAKSEATSIADVRTVLTRLSLHYSDADEDAGDRVTLSTLHGAKGLEFGTVFFIGCDDGIIPHARTDAPKATDVLSTINAGEERRLFYVGVTRAKDRLYLVRAKERSGRGAPRAMTPSRYLMGLPEAQIERIEYDAQAPLPPAELAASARRFRESLEALKKAK